MGTKTSTCANDKNGQSAVKLLKSRKTRLKHRPMCNNRESAKFAMNRSAEVQTLGDSFIEGIYLLIYLFIGWSPTITHSPLRSFLLAPGPASSSLWGGSGVLSAFQRTSGRLPTN